LKAAVAFCLVLLLSASLKPQTMKENPSQPAVLSAQVKHGQIVYELNGRVVEDNAQNSILKNLARILDTRGSSTPVFVVVDVHAPFSEFGKLATALDKVGLPKRRFFVTDFTDATMNEVHWDEKAVPIPKN